MRFELLGFIIDEYTKRFSIITVQLHKGTRSLLSFTLVNRQIHFDVLFIHGQIWF